MTLLEAMARQEGFGVPDARPTRNNNPGDLEYGPFAKAHGAYGTDGRFAKFVTVEDGFAAMKALLVERYQGLTIEQALNKYAPPVENETNVYLANVCEWSGVLPTEDLQTALNA